MTLPIAGSWRDVRAADQEGATVSPTSPFESGNWPPTTADLSKRGPAATTRNYYDYDECEPIECPQCHWTGLADEGAREYYHDLFDVSCPRCDKMLLIISHPTIAETKAAAAAGNPSALEAIPHVERIEEFQRLFETRKLRSPRQLPDLEGEKLAFLWDEEVRSETERLTLIRIGARIIWSEPELWEGARRFEQVKELLKQRYGSRFRSLTPTRQSEMYLYGDDPSLLANGGVSID
jgi:hypothetical protein